MNRSHLFSKLPWFRLNFQPVDLKPGSTQLELGCGITTKIIKVMRNVNAFALILF